MEERENWEGLCKLEGLGEIFDVGKGMKTLPVLFLNSRVGIRLDFGLREKWPRGELKVKWICYQFANGLRATAGLKPEVGRLGCGLRMWAKQQLRLKLGVGRVGCGLREGWIDRAGYYYLGLVAWSQIKPDDQLTGQRFPYACWPLFREH
ncbi:hypothetical protein BY996DRAFT_6586599 [Phakopsora pachyrhizi]|nr:hypothetical protein BY996DRAFT_6586599 [Phakopsora pachyrhizi]